MKKILFSLLILIGFGAKAQFVNIPDSSFRNYLFQLYPFCFNANMQMDTTCNSIVNETVLSPSNLNISSIDGVQYFDNLDSLTCSGNSISVLPLLPKKLTHLWCLNNQLSGLPALPDSLKILFCQNNQILLLPSLPSTLLFLKCSENLLTALPSLPNAMNRLECAENLLATLPPLPGTISHLSCSFNQLTFLPILPNGLIHLACDNNPIGSMPALPNSITELSFGSPQLMQLPELPPNLQSFGLYSTKFKSLPALPNTLQDLYCYDNKLTRLPNLPDSLSTLSCQNNFLTSLPGLPQTLIWLDCTSNSFLDCLPTLPDNLLFLFTGLTNISCYPNFPPGIWGLPSCGPSSSCAKKPGISGVVFNDLNFNGVYDALIDSVLENWKVINSNDWYASSGSVGQYQLKLDSGLVNIVNCIPVKPYFVINPSSYTITPTGSGSQGTNFNFAVHQIPNVTDLVVEIASGIARPGFNQWVSATILNDGTENATNATLKLLKPATFNFLNATPSISQQIGDTLIWNNINLNVFKSKTFLINWNISANVTIGSPYQLQSWIIPVNNDTTPSNNHTIDDGTIVGSYDPNDKTVSKQTVDENATSELKYTVRFQNTGTDTAFNIMIRDELSENLDIASFRMIGASHEYSYQIRDKGLLEVFFQDILLEDSTSNEPASHGFFQYAIKPKPNLTVLDSITNTASIYFDFNAPVVTNTTTTKVIVTGISEWGDIPANIYPNPVQDRARVLLPGLEGVLILSDITGNILFKLNVKNGSEIDLSSFPAGLYIAKISTVKGTKVFSLLKE